MSSNQFWRKTGFWSLVVLIVGDILMLGLGVYSAITTFRLAWFWVSCFGIITLVVLVHELVAVITNRKTISTMFGEWAKVQPWHAVTFATLFIIIMNALYIHLIAYWLKLIFP